MSETNINQVLPALLGRNLDELTKIVVSGGMPRFVGKQLADWLYKKRVTDFDEMNNISKKNREWLQNNYVIGRSKPSGSVKSSDGTVKYTFKVAGGNIIESVLIPEKSRNTLCVSSQAGCRMNCYFCATGRNGFKAHLTVSEILNQILNFPLSLNDTSDNPDELTNIVFMGMGEPLDNIEPVLKAIDVLTSAWGIGWSPKRITVSTVGKLPQLKELLDNTKVHVAVSLHTAEASQREQLMPAQRPYPIAAVVNLLKGYDFSKQRRLSFEYILWRGVNDDKAHAEMVVKLLKGLDCRVNLIKFHSIPGVKLVPASEERMFMFRNYLSEHGIFTTIRASRGEDIMAACGMLAAKGSSKIEC